MKYLYNRILFAIGNWFLNRRIKITQKDWEKEGLTFDEIPEPVKEILHFEVTHPFKEFECKCSHSPTHPSEVWDGCPLHGAPDR